MPDAGLSEAAFRRWLDGYQAAWETADPDAAAALFTTDGSYRETPFQAPMVGRDAIRAYWHKEVVLAQRDVAFGYAVWTVTGDVGLCRWWVRFTWARGGGRVRLDGVFRCAFTRGDDGAVLCRSLEEWWHRQDG